MELNKKVLFDWLTVILDDSTFKKDMENKKISLKQKLTVDEIDGLHCLILNLLGKENVKADDGIPTKFKFNSKYLDLDNETLKVMPDGHVYVDIDYLLDKININEMIERSITNENFVLELCHNEEFAQRIREHFNVESIAMTYAEQYLLNDESFLARLKEKLQEE